ncbi:MAG: PDZ domain-containing protein [Oscillospiraceae bacterium]|nr:PDZ domain-containing protein [Oscillospiraceae bacterium]
MKKWLIAILSYILVAALSSVLTLTVYVGLGGSSKLDQLSALIDACHIDDVDVVKLEDAAASAMVKAAGDRWSYYIPASQWATYQEESENAYVGIGVTITVSRNGDGFQVTEVDENGPAAKAGILVDDIIIAIAGQDVSGMTTTDGRNLVRGKEGTPVEITVRRNGETIVIPVIRQKLEITVVWSEMLTEDVGLIAIDNFEKRSASETLEAIEALLDQGAEKLIFDVRNNPGGYASELVEVLDYLLPAGDLFRTVDFLGNEEIDTSDAGALDIPMAVLVNGNSYSAAEFFAVALQEYDAAIVVGEKTTGKGYFQQTFPLSDGSAVSLSTGKYYTPNGISLEGVGITPDVEIIVDEETMLKIYYDQMDSREDPQIQAALEALK